MSGFGQHYNHAMEFYRPEMVEIRMKYIRKNPVRAGIVGEPEDYVYSKARNYLGLNCLIEVDCWLVPKQEDFLPALSQ